MQPAPSPNSSPNQEPIWIQLLLIGAAAGMAFLLWSANQTSAPNKPKAPVRRAVVKIRHLPPRTINPFRPRAAPRPTKRPAKPIKLTYKPTDFLYPPPFELKLKERQAFYQKAFDKAKQMKLDIHAKEFIKVLHKEGVKESITRSYQIAMVRLSAIRYYAYKGRERYLSLGFLQLHKLEELLDAYLAKGGPIDAIPNEGQPLHQLANQMKPYGGFYPALLESAGIRTQTKELSPQQRFWIRTVYMARWCRYTLGHKPVPVVMGKVLYEDFTKARLYYSRKPQRRLWAVRELRRMYPDFPVERVLGWLFLQLKQPKLGIKSLKEALKRNPKDKVARSILDRLLKSPS